jgi:lysophospholipase L1-like esterase
MTDAGLAATWELVSLLIGVNDQYRGREVAVFEPAFSALLHRSVALAGGRPDRTFVLTIPDWSVTPFARASDRDREQMAAELDAYNSVVRRVCEGAGVVVFDVTTSTQRTPDAVVDDDLHPDRASYRRWVELIVDDVDRLMDDGRDDG